MLPDAESLPPKMATAAIAVKCGGGGSRRAVRWASENLEASLFILVHVIPPITSIPTPSGDYTPVTEVDENVVRLYVQEVKHKHEESFAPFKRLFKNKKMEVLVLEDENPANGLSRYLSDSRINILVLGSCFSNYLSRKIKGHGLPDAIFRCAPGTCVIHVVSRNTVVTKSAGQSSTKGKKENASSRDKHITLAGGISLETTGEAFAGMSFPLEHSHLHASAISSEDASSCASFSEESANHSCREDRESTAGTQVEEFALDLQTEIDKLRQELQNTLAMYDRTCEELVHTQNKVQLLSSECLEEARKVNAAMGRDEMLRKLAAEEKARNLQAMKEIEEAKRLLSSEAYGRQIAELNALRESIEKQDVLAAVLHSDRRYRRYTPEDIDAAISESNVIGEGGYGKVYKCTLDNTPVAVKILRPDATDKKDEFLKEIEVLSQLHHPHIVLLLGACPENGCLVYEYLDNGNLEDYITQRNGKSPLPWFIRFRIIFEVASALAFLHNSKPVPIVHRDLKPSNILLDKNHVSKIGDVGLARLISDSVPDNITEYRHTLIAGTFYYMDPEYQRTGTVRPKSDLYALGVTTLQLLTSRHPNGLIPAVEKAVMNHALADILDKSISDWPFPATEELACMALNCCKLRCRDRPDLDNEVLPVLRRVYDTANACVSVGRSYAHAPGHYFCPILQEVMDEPYIAGDGFTYEHRAIKAWLERHNVSPVTKHRFPHRILTPNHTLRLAIQEWRSHLPL